MRAEPRAEGEFTLRDGPDIKALPRHAENERRKMNERPMKRERKAERYGAREIARV